MQALQEKIPREINLTIRDESDDEREVEGQIDQAKEEEEALNRKEEKYFKAISIIGKRSKFDVPTFLGNINLEDLIDWNNELQE